MIRPELLQEKAIEYVTLLFAGNSGGHDAEHTLRVYRMALYIAEREPGCDREIVALAALLHDVDDPKLFSTAGNRHARDFLAAQNVHADRIELICRAVNSVSFSLNRGQTPDTPEGRIVQDADRLDAIGAVGIARTFAYGGEHGRPLRDSVRHFYDKLLLLKDMMNTDTAKRIAAERHAFIENYLKELEVELGPDPETV
ncbi:MAG: HD domain-containing protein [Clostridia bacterium]|nr:HD domain-containing protein [Clostridia bacterium]